MLLLKEVHLLQDQILHHWDYLMEVDYEIDLLQTINQITLYYNCQIELLVFTILTASGYTASVSTFT